MGRAQVLSMVLAGGEGKRLQPLTAQRAKPAVPFGGYYRLIDFVLSNLVNSSFRRIVVLTQYKSHSLDRHLAQTWRMSPLLGNYVTPVGPQMRQGRHWFTGSANAIYQNLNLIGDEQPDYLLVFGADHVYRMDARQMLDAHIASGAGVTVAGIRVPRDQAGQFGVIQTMGHGHPITGFEEKPPRATGLPDAPDEVLASMGNYIFTAKALIEAVLTDAEDRTSAHDIGGNIIPMFVKSRDAVVYDFVNNDVPGMTARDKGYWRDIGTLDAYYDAHMDLISVHPVFNLYNKDWPILTWHEPLPPAKFVFDWPGRVGHALDSMVCPGVVISGGVVRRSILSPDVLVHSRTAIEGSVLLHGVDVGRHAIVRHAIVDKGVRIPEGARIGLDPERDRARYTVSPNGVVVIGKGAKVEPE